MLGERMMDDLFDSILEHFKPQLLYLWAGILLPAAFVFVGGCSGAATAPIPPHVVRGTMDLGSWDFEKYGAVKLDGDWEFYWNRLLEPAQFHTGIPPLSDGYIPVPSVWTGLRIRGTKLPANGYATFRLMLISPRVRNLHFLFPDMATAYRAYINGDLVSTNGVVAVDRAHYSPAKKYLLFGVESASTTNEIVVQVANFNYFKGGIWLSIETGDERSIVKDATDQRSLELFIIGILSITILYHFGLFVIRRKDRTPLVFSILCFMILLRTLSTGSYILLEIFPFTTWSMLIQVEYLMLIIPGPIAIHYIYLLFDRKFPGKLLVLLYSISGFFAASVIFTRPGFFTNFANVYEGFLAVQSLILAYYLIRLCLKKNILSIIILTGFLVVIATVFNDILYSKLLFNYFGYLVPAGFITLIFSQSLALSIKFSGAFNEVEDLSRNLDLKVQERTSELKATMSRQAELNNQLLNSAVMLEKEKTELKQKTAIMEAELELARNIQMRMFPGSSLDPRIAFLYRAMEQVGGDFLDFNLYPQDKIGIFISDVSGHGVPAAFITTMIKTTFSQIAPAINNPAYLLKHLNRVLFNQTTGNFITAFYGIIDFRNREFVYANAGHPVPLIHADGRTGAIASDEKNFPLCTMSNEEMQAEGREYRNNRVILPSGGRLLLFTDGLTETVRENDNREKKADFESDGLYDSISEAGGKSAAEFVEIIFARLKAFHGSESFDDDVCIIGVEC